MYDKPEERVVHVPLESSSHVSFQFPEEARLVLTSLDLKSGVIDVRLEKHFDVDDPQ